MVRYLIGALLLCLVTGTVQAEPLAAPFLYEGKLAEGEKALTAHLAEKPSDDQARLGLAAVQLFSGFERLGKSMHRYGLRTKSNLIPMPAAWRKLMPENPEPERISYTAFRQILQQIIDDVKVVDGTLAKIRDVNVKLPLHLYKVRIDLFGQGKMVNLAMFIQGLGLPAEAKVAERLSITFDAGDVAWLRGYCNGVAGACETYLALDTQPVFRTLAHRVFRNPDTLNKAQLATFEKRLEAEDEPEPSKSANISLTAFLRKIPVKEPARLKKALGHFEAMMGHSLQMWQLILAETDNDNEWIPSPTQVGPIGGAITRDMVRIAQTILGETREMLAGTKVLTPPTNPLAGLLPGLTPATPTNGINIRKMFTNPPKVIDVPAIVGGPGLLPFITPGVPTDLTGPPMIAEITRVFPGNSLLGFGFRTN